VNVGTSKTMKMTTTMTTTTTMMMTTTTTIPTITATTTTTMMMTIIISIILQMIIYPKTATANRKVATLEGYNAPKLRETIIFNRAISYAL